MPEELLKNVRIESRPDGLRITYQKREWIGIFALAFGFLWSSFVLSFIALVGADGTMLLLQTPFMLFGIAILYGGCCALFGKLVITVDAGSVRSFDGFGGIGRRRRIDRMDFSALGITEVQKSAKSGSYWVYRLEADLPDGNTYRLCSLRDKTAANVILTALLSRLPNAERPPEAVAAGAYRKPLKRHELLVFSVGIVLSSLFCLGFGWFAWRTIEAQSWPEVPCTIRSSSMDSHHKSKGGISYNLRLSYEYEFKQQKFYSDRYGFWDFSTSDCREARAVLDDHAPGTRKLCRVNPNDPAEAVLYAEFHWFYLFALIPLTMLIAFIAGLIAYLRKRQSRPECQ